MNLIFSPYIIFLVGLIMLIYGSELVINNCIKIANKFNVSKVIIGATVIAFGTSFPELVISGISSLKGNSDIAISNIIGSNIANIGLVLGLLAIFKPIVCFPDLRIKYNCFYLVLSTLLFSLISFFNAFNFFSGILFLILFCLFIFFIFKKYSKGEKELFESLDETKNYSIILKLFIGFLLIGFGSEYFIDSTINISAILGFDNNIPISMTLVALGTSLPELITSFIALIRREKDFAIGNILGSNIINILLVIGVSAIINPIFVQFFDIKECLMILLFITFILVVVIYFLHSINRLIGIIFICIYFLFIYINFFI